MEFHDTKKMITALVKLRGSLDGAPSLWWYGGSQYALIDMESHLLWQVEGVQLSKFAPLENGGWRHTLRDVMFYLDRASGELLETFVNEWTGQSVSPPIARFGPFSVNYTVDGQLVDLPPEMRDSMSVNWCYEPAITQGNDIYVREYGVTKIAKPVKGDEQATDWHHINDYLTMVGSRSEVEDPAVMEAAARNTYSSVSNWSPWMNMGDQPGMLVGRGNSTKIGSRDELPAKLLALVDKHEPNFFKDPDFPIWEKTYHPLNLDDQNPKG